MNALKSAKCADGRAGNIGKLQIELHDFVSRDLAGIRNRNGGIQRAARIERCLRQSEIAVLESRVAEAVSEGPERLALEVPVGATLHRVILEVRQLMDIFIE